jgi:hypothetical protein
MGAAATMSTPGAWLFSPKEAGDGYVPPFSGKLSSVMPTCDDKIPSNPQVPTTKGVPVQGAPPTATAPHTAAPREIGGRDGPEPTRFGDWELRGRCIDF